jgi:hypothetical protein
MDAKPNFITRFRSAWNVFKDGNQKLDYGVNYGASYGIPQFRRRLTLGNERSIIGALFNRCAVDVSALKMRHARVDKSGTFLEEIDSGLNRCLSVEANVDQAARAFIQDVTISLFDEGVVAIVPTDTSVSLLSENTFDILTMRTARIVQWYPYHVRVSLYNEKRGEREELTLPKEKVAIIENPLYSVMNEPNSISKRLIWKLNLLDAIDEQAGSGKLDLIIQLPYVVKGDTKQKMAEQRRKDMEEQLKDSQYGVAYIDGTEKIVQLNRPAENNMMTQIEFLTRMLYSQLGMSEKILDGTADEAELLNYYNRTIEPVASAIVDEMKRKFLTKTAQSQGQTVMHFRNLFSIVTPERLAELADKLTRNEIMSSNDMRAVIGLPPSNAPGADELRNKNLHPNTAAAPIDVTNEFSQVKKNEGD